MEKITSLKNDRIKNLIKLQAKARERKAQNLFPVEGAREISYALSRNYAIHSVFLYPALYEKSDYPGLLQQVDPAIIYEVNDAVFDKIAYREGSDGIIALCCPQEHKLDSLSLPDNPFIIVLESVEKPGNLGAILRTADAAHADALIVCDPLTDVYNPNVIRSSIGCVFTVPIAISTNQEAFDFLRDKHIRTFAAELNTDRWYHQTDFRSPSAIIMGTEADGLTDFWLSHADERIKIPMRGAIDSLNVSVSTAIITFEAMRQRGFE